MTTMILAAIGAIVLNLQTAAQLPPALAALLRSLRFVRDAAHDLRIPQARWHSHRCHDGGE
jgi:hypothetical protein